MAAIAYLASDKLLTKPAPKPVQTSQSQMTDAFMAEFERRVRAQEGGSSPLRS